MWMMLQDEMAGGRAVATVRVEMWMMLQDGIQVADGKALVG